MPHIRPAAVAGTFYPEHATTLTAQIQSLLKAAEGDAPPSPPKAMIVPHAGYIYSGPIAAHAYAQLLAHAATLTRVVLLGPVHRVPVRGLALPDADAFSTPLGVVPIDRAARAAVVELPQVVTHSAAHAFEHSLEVQLPFLQTVLGEFQLLPLAVGDAEPSAVAEVLDRLWGGRETLIVVSSDLSHYLSYDQARAVDRATVDAILQLSEQPLNHHQACGGTPVNGLLHCARRRGLHSELLDLRNSGDTAGDRAQVVGYAAIAFHEPGDQYGSARARPA